MIIYTDVYFKYIQLCAKEYLLPKFLISAKLIHSSKQRISQQYLLSAYNDPGTTSTEGLCPQGLVAKAMNEAEGKLKGRRRMGIAIPQRYPEAAPGGKETRRIQAVRPRGGCNSQPHSGLRPPPEAAGQLLPLTQRPHFRANGLHHEVC